MFYSTEVMAKKVVIEWKPMDQAINYELAIYSDNKPFMTKSITDTRWKGDLSPGVYTYQIRSYDKLNRPGQWTQWKSLAVMPPALKMTFPADGAKLDFYHPDAPVTLKWEMAPGIQSYTVEIQKEGKTISKTKVNGSQAQFNQLKEGAYTWQVRPVLSLGATAPENLRGKSWEPPKAEKGEFEIRQRNLETPVLLSPKGNLAPADDRSFKLKWEEVEGAEGYLVRVARTPQKVGDPTQTAVETLSKTRAYFTKSNEWVGKVGGEGSFVWGVRALAHLEYSDKIGSLPVPKAQSKEGMAEFSLDRNAVFSRDFGYLAASTMIAPYSYQLSSPANNIQGSTSAGAVVYRVSGEFWLKPLFALAFGAELAMFQMSGQSFSRPQVELTGKFRTQLSSGTRGWSLSPKIGAELRDYNYILPTDLTLASSTSLSGRDLMIFGGSVGFDLRKQLTDDISLGIKAAYFYPVGIFANSGIATGLNADGSYRNFGVGVQGLYWMSHSFGLGVGGYFEYRSIAFNTSGASLPEKVYMDGIYFFGSLVYRIWR